MILVESEKTTWVKIDFTELIWEWPENCLQIGHNCTMNRLCYSWKSGTNLFWIFWILLRESAEKSYSYWTFHAKSNLLRYLLMIKVKVIKKVWIFLHSFPHYFKLKYAIYKLLPQLMEEKTNKKHYNSILRHCSVM